MFESMRRVVDDVNALVSAATPVSGVTAIRRAFAPGVGAGRPMPVDRPDVCPNSGRELREWSDPRARRPRGPRTDADAAGRTSIDAGDKIRPRLTVRVYMRDSAAYPADGGRVSTL
jgi:hypothetical protein